MNENSVWAIMLWNLVSITCWVALAVIFDKWWIALFALLFIGFPAQVHKYYRICDKCGKHSEFANSYNEALDKAKAAGWVHFVEGNLDYCAECRAALHNGGVLRETE
jgi:hypothetical protein